MPKPDKKQRRPIGSYVSNNLLLKVLSFVFAVVLWSFVISQTNPVRTKTLTDIPITVTGLDKLQRAGYTVRDSDAANGLHVTVRVNASHSHYRFVDKNTVSATIDLSQITNDGAVTLPVLVTLANVGDVSLVSVTPSTVSLAIDTFLTKEVPLKLETTGDLPDGLISLAPSYPETVSISGAGYYVERIASAILDVNLSALTDGASVSGLCRFADESNNAIKFPGVRVSADMDVMTVQEVSVDAESAVTGTPKAGYQLARITVGKVMLCGHQSAIESLTALTPDAIDLTGKSDSFSVPLTFTMPEGVFLVPDQDPIDAQIEITEEPLSVSLSRPLTITGLGTPHARLTDGTTTLTVSENGATSLRVHVTITGPRSLLDSITGEDVIVRLALDGRGAGTYELTPSVALSTALASGVTAQITSPTRLTVTLY